MRSTYSPKLIELQQRHWTGVGEPRALASPRFTGFHGELVARLVAEVP